MKKPPFRLVAAYCCDNNEDRMRDFVLVCEYVWKDYVEGNPFQSFNVKELSALVERMSIELEKIQSHEKVLSDIIKR